jgi:hypothetical protein
MPAAETVAIVATVGALGDGDVKLPLDQRRVRDEVEGEFWNIRH